jgi:hypothetical protein
MYTSEIRETDQEGKPVAVSPALLAQVRKADDALREHLRDETKLEYAGLWSFPDPNRATLALTLRVPILPEGFAVSVPFDPRRAERFPSNAVQTALRHASETNQAKLSRQIRELVASTIDIEDD